MSWARRPGSCSRAGPSTRSSIRSFEGWPRERHEQLKGELWREVRLKPGDLLYLPRGQYHYALADDGACVHIALGVTYPIGMDVVSYAVRADGRASRSAAPTCRGTGRRSQARLAEIGADRCAETLAEPKAVEDVLALVRRLPLAARDLRPARADRAGRGGLPRQGRRLAPGLAGRPASVWSRGHAAGRRGAGGDPASGGLGAGARLGFARRELAAAFPAAESPATLDQLLAIYAGWRWSSRATDPADRLWQTRDSAVVECHVAVTRVIAMGSVGLEQGQVRNVVDGSRCERCGHGSASSAGRNDDKAPSKVENGRCN